jgi:glycine betaine transporter
MSHDPHSQDLQAFEKRLRREYRRDSDRELIAQKVEAYKTALEDRIVAEEARSPDEVRAEEKSNINLNLILSLVAVLLFNVWAYWNSEQMLRLSKQIKLFITGNLGWFFVLLSTASLLYLAWLAFSRFGDVVLGDPDQQPEFSNLAWYSMLFSAGMGVGILFWGGTEPIVHYLANPLGESGTTQAARQAMALTMFHWGFHGWGVYTLCAVAVAFHGFRHRKNYLISSAVAGLARTPATRRTLGVVADLTATLAVIFGVAASLGTGSLQLAAGLDSTLGRQVSTPNGYTVIIACLTVCFLLSASTGLKKGIRILSELNMGLAALLLAFVFLAGPTLLSLKLTVDTLGNYLTQLPGLSFKVAPFTTAYEQWMADWTITYFTWWVAWTPFVGIFIARISRGRTIKELILGSTMVPVMMTLVWFSVFGATSFSLVLNGDQGLQALIEASNFQGALFYLLARLPFSQLSSLVALTLIATFLITSADSACFVVAMMTSEGDLEPSSRLKVVWGLVIAVITAFLVREGRLDPIQAAAQISAVPFSLILILMAVFLPVKLAHHVEARRL